MFLSFCIPTHRYTPHARTDAADSYVDVSDTCMRISEVRIPYFRVSGGVGFAHRHARRHILGSFLGRPGHSKF